MSKILRLIIVLCFFFKGGNSQSCGIAPIKNTQSNGGKELLMVHRTDISNNAYQIFLRRNVIHGLGSFQSPLTAPSLYGAGWFLTDSCSGRFKNLQTILFNSGLPNVTSHNFNIFTRDSVNQRIHKLCPPEPVQQFQKIDSFIYQRELLTSNIIYLPYTCGKWQLIHNGQGAGTDFTDSSTNIEYPCQASQYPLHFLPWGQYYKDATLSTCVLQWSNLQPNSAPYFASDLDFLARTYHWTSYQ